MPFLHIHGHVMEKPLLLDAALLSIQAAGMEAKTVGHDVCDANPLKVRQTSTWLCFHILS